MQSHWIEPHASLAGMGLSALALLLSYLLGAVPWGWLMARTLRGIDLRQVGSGNIGATNAMRALGKPLGYVAFALDCAKGWVPVAVLAAQLCEPAELPWMRVLCGAAAVVGHVWPIYLGFRGGKAVATGLGAVAALDPWILAVGGAAWLIVFYGSGFVSLASIAMGLSFPAMAWYRARGGQYGGEVVLGTLALAVLIVWRHRANVQRIVAGTEPRRARKREESHG